jgi:hypothetical protein
VAENVSFSATLARRAENFGFQLHGSGVFSSAIGSKAENSRFRPRFGIAQKVEKQGLQTGAGASRLSTLF